MIRNKDNKSHQKKLNSDTNTVMESSTSQSSVFIDAVQEFESKCQSLSHFSCQCCQMTGITIKPSHKNGALCTTCQSKKTRTESIINDLPIWFDKNGIVQYHLPKEL